MQPISTEDILKERIKELTCLYDITSAILQHAGDADATLLRICTIVKDAYRFSEDAFVELHLQTHTIPNAALPPETVCQASTIMVLSEQSGYIKVHYDAVLHTEEHFLVEEQKLLDKVAIEIGNFLEKLISIDKANILQRSIAYADRLSILGEITAGIAHELNTPLGNILGFGELIKEHTNDVQVAEDISKIINAAIHSREIVKKLMFFSCEMPQHLEYLDLTEVLKQSLSLLGPNFSKKQIVCNYNYEDTGIKARFDSIQFTQVLFNILLNAIYASPDGGEIKVSLTTQGNNAYIEISDQGTGIPDTVKPKVFEPFFTTKPVGEGTGLGLSVVHGIVKAHGGDISIIDNEPSGTIFRIRLPLN